MTGPKTNEREGTKALLRYSRMSPYKAREVLDLIRGKDVALAADILRFSERDAAIPIGKLLNSAVANAANNDGLDPDELYVSACYADEGTTIKRWRPRARGRATRIRKRTCHVTIVVSRLPADRLARLQAKRNAEQLTRRARRVAGGRRGAAEAAVARGRRGRRGPAEDATTAELEAREAEIAAAEDEANVVDAQSHEAAGVIDEVEIATAEETGAEETGAETATPEDGDESAAGAATSAEAGAGASASTDAEPDADEAPEGKSE